MIRVVTGDLAFHAADAIIRPATTRLDPTAAALRSVEKMGGPEFLNRLRLSRDLAVGAAVVTAAGGHLPAEFVIHAVIRSDAEPVSRGSVAGAWLSALHQAQAWQFAHISAPPIGIGAGNLSLETSAEIMMTVLHAHLVTAQFPTDVSFVVETPEESEVFEAALRRHAATGESA